MTLIIINITNYNENNDYILQKHYFETLLKLLETTHEKLIMENLLIIFNNLLFDEQNYNFTITLIPSLPSFLSNLLSKDEIQFTSINYKLALIKLNIQVCKYSVENINSYVRVFFKQFCDEQLISSLLKYINLGYFSLELMNETLSFINLLLRSDNESIIKLFLDFKLTKILIELFDTSFEVQSIDVNIKITKILANLLYGSASQVEVIFY